MFSYKPEIYFIILKKNYISEDNIIKMFTMGIYMTRLKTKKEVKNKD
jgi:hypothetical protein